jgi:predicted metal-dependent hydrolase
MPTQPSEHAQPARAANEIIDGCQEPSPPELLHGIEQFNHREYFECHETLEGLWNREPRPIRTLYKGILQVGVGCYHLLRGNYHGAVVKLGSGADYLEPFAPRCQGVEVARLISDARQLRARLIELGPEQFRAVDLKLLPLVHLAPGPQG